MRGVLMPLPNIGDATRRVRAGAVQTASPRENIVHRIESEGEGSYLPQSRTPRSRRPRCARTSSPSRCVRQTLLGTLTIYRQEVRAFTDRQIGWPHFATRL